MRRFLIGCGEYSKVVEAEHPHAALLAFFHTFPPALEVKRTAYIAEIVGNPRTIETDEFIVEVGRGLSPVSKGACDGE